MREEAKQGGWGAERGAAGERVACSGLGIVVKLSQERLQGAGRYPIRKLILSLFKDL